ncbi:GNAT family N-acetyltransferase [Lysobacter ciconiae]|uniref:GNAT family N-acetyltransferase n=1 Tax=Novilysobacter ciconiae TaxID=2781022 RepID=A0A7S6UEU5_9GAMM|nr:GNAT family N-acetyltransferase [Lysobacter ciconiae]QOW18983.1 GNAT family N-acetyltransferase [Lysobacter ciconiae]
MNPLTEVQSRHESHPSQRSLTVSCRTGTEVAAVLDDVARLRANVLQAWPDLHDGDARAERARLEGWAKSWRGIAVLVMDQARLVGAALGLPLEDEEGVVRDAFDAAGRAIAPVFLLAGSVLLPGYRGRGLGHRFFSERENHAHSLGGFESTMFMAFERDQDDPRRPPFWRSNEAFWRRRGYSRNDALTLPLKAGPETAAFPPARQVAWARPLERGC